MRKTDKHRCEEIDNTFNSFSKLMEQLSERDKDLYYLAVKLLELH